MSFVAVAVGIGVSTAVGVGSQIYAGNVAAKGAKRAAATSAAGTQGRIDYLLEQEALPQELRSGALARIGGLAGLPGGEGTQEEAIARAKESPLYGAIMSGREAGEESLLRTAGSIGQLRSGNVKEALYESNIALENKALLESLAQEKQLLSGLASLPSQASEIGLAIEGKGATIAAGQTGVARAKVGAITGVGDVLQSGVGSFLKEGII